MTKAEARKRVAELVERFEQLKKSGHYRKYNEAAVCKNFILPLFEALGWDTQSDEVSAEEHTSAKDRADYGFYLNGRPKFYLEAKKPGANIQDDKFAQQATAYSWNKGIDWAVLTNFETLKVFSAQDLSEHLSHRQFFEINFNEYATKSFDQLWWLSKEAFEKNVLDEEAEKVGKKLKRVSVTETLYKDLNQSREMLLKSFHDWNKELDYQLLEEGVQRLLDRLIFIRVAEDRQLEPPTLIPLLRAHGGSSSEKFYEDLVAKFRELDKVYNSNLFAPHPLEEWGEYSGDTGKVIEILHGEPGYYEYNFEAIPADILGSVYENYLGYKLSQSAKGLEVSKDARKRKEQGIYYTPSYIVDYIVDNALKPILDRCESVEDVQRIKVLDPACGSGSFLIRAMEVIFEWYKKYNPEADELTKINILQNNIFGVDLDEQAVEIARLNLLITALDTRMKLPDLSGNIKNGNSLISGTNTELEKAFGKNYRDKKPFDWQYQFPQVFSRENPGFDVIIGNPPYVRNRELGTEDKNFFNTNYATASGQYDLYQLFFEKSLKMLKHGGLLGFITSNKYAIADYGKKLREYLLEQFTILRILDVSHLNVFKEASTYPYVILIENKKSEQNKIKTLRAENETDLFGDYIELDQDAIAKTPTKNLVIKEEVTFFARISEASEKLGDVVTIKETIHTGNIRNKLIVDKKVDDNCKKLLAGKDCHRYSFAWNGKWLRYDKSLVDKSKNEYANLVGKEYFDNPKIFLREIALNIECSYDDEKYYALNKVYSVQSTGSYNIKYILALLNSKLLSYYFRKKFEEAHVQNGYLQFKKMYTAQIPIFKLDLADKIQKDKHDELAQMADKMTTLNKELQSTEGGSNNWSSIRSEIEKIDHQIDQLVYELYRLAPEEISLIEPQK